MLIDTEQKLYMILLGCKPKARLTEQHDIFFGIAPSLPMLVPQLKKFWPQGKSNLHIDAWRLVSVVDGYKISICKGVAQEPQNLNLFFVNLGGYIKGNFDELHYKMLVVAPTVLDASEKAKTVDFYKTTGFAEAPSHIDNKYEVDDIINIMDVFTPGQFYLHIEQLNNPKINEDEIHIGYFELDTLQE